MTYAPTKHTTLHRIPARGSYDRATVHAILDEALVCHLGFVADDRPFVVPTTFARDGEALYVHGAAASRTLRALATGIPACVTVTLVDGLVLARSAFRHSMNYRSVVALGVAHEVLDEATKLHALALFVDKVAPGRSASARVPNEKELKATTVLEMPLEAVSAKVRTGPPNDLPEDIDWPAWAGVVPLALVAGPPVPVTDAHPLPVLPRALADR
jgi:hypothetical protein